VKSLALDFDTPAPFSGSTPLSRHCSYTGAQAAGETWTARQVDYIALLTEGGSFTDKQAAAELGWDVSSVCSIRNSVRTLLETDGYEVVQGPRRSTKRTKWKLR
jgi:hypothetical protein